MIFKKAQVTMETIFIYGIVAIVVLSGVGALMYFGVLDFGSYLPDQFKMKGDIVIPEFSFLGDNTSFVTLGLENRNSKVLTISRITLEQPEGAFLFNESLSVCDYNLSLQLPPKKVNAVVMPCVIAPGSFDNQKMALNVKIVYTNQGGAVAQTTSGTGSITVN